MRILLSFDIDGTLETGDPPGPISLDMVRYAQELGCIIGSASDRSISSQTAMWERNNIVVDFVSNKHVLIDIKQRFEADYYLHMGDRELDRQFALEAEFEFMWMDEAASQPWIAMQNGSITEAPEGNAETGASRVVITSAQPQSVGVPAQAPAIRPTQFSTADCVGTDKNPGWCDTHHRPFPECKRYEAGMGLPQKVPDGLD
ncbi:MAG: hypothetical protein QF579_00695 [Dehalococcoidia bacterium]|nr:hypothetical protein [Dehalococcoidia bacterium]